MELRIARDLEQMKIRNMMEDNHKQRNEISALIEEAGPGPTVGGSPVVAALRKDRGTVLNPVYSTNAHAAS